MTKRQNNDVLPNAQIALKVFVMTALAAFLSFFLYMSISVAVTGLTTETIGYRIVQIEEDGSNTLITEHWYANDTPTSGSSAETGMATQDSAGESSDITGTPSTTAAAEATLPSNQVQQYVRSEIPASVSVAVDILSTLLMLIILTAMPYSVLWKQGDRDANAVRFGQMGEDRLRGLKIGLMAALPSFLAYILLLFSRVELFSPRFIVYYRLGNMPFLPLINRMMTHEPDMTASLSWSAMLVIFLTLMVVPLVSFIAYRWGYRHFSLSETLTYQKKRK